MPKAPVFQPSKRTTPPLAFSVIERFAKEEHQEMEYLENALKQQLSNLKWKDTNRMLIVKLRGLVYTNDCLTSWLNYGASFLESEGFVVQKATCVRCNELRYTIDFKKTKERMEQAKKEEAAWAFQPQEHLFECRICNLQMKDSMFTECGHVLCQSCSSKLNAASDWTGIIKCPFCKRSTTCSKLFL